LKRKYLKAWVVGTLVVGASCHHPKTEPTPEATAPFPVSSLAGRDIGVLPFTLVLADDSLHWDLSDRAKTLTIADSVLWASLTTRITEIPWKSPAHIWRSTRGATGMPDDPRQLGTSILRGVQVATSPIRCGRSSGPWAPSPVGPSFWRRPLCSSPRPRTQGPSNLLGRAKPR
jgi:hypothetical protein